MTKGGRALPDLPAPPANRVAVKARITATDDAMIGGSHEP
jgi:hypothetical protein